MQFKMSNPKRDKRALIILGIFLIIFVPICIAVNNSGGGSVDDEIQEVNQVNENAEDKTNNNQE